MSKFKVGEKVRLNPTNCVGLKNEAYSYDWIITNTSGNSIDVLPYNIDCYYGNQWKLMNIFGQKGYSVGETQLLKISNKSPHYVGKFSKATGI